MKLPKYKQPLYDKYINTDFKSEYNLTDAEKEVFDKAFIECMKSPYSLLAADYPGYKEYFKHNKDALKSLVDKGLLMYYGNSSLLGVTFVIERLREIRKERDNKRKARNARK